VYRQVRPQAAGLRPKAAAHEGTTLIPDCGLWPVACGLWPHLQSIASVLSVPLLSSMRKSAWIAVLSALSCAVHGHAFAQEPASAAYLKSGRWLRIIATNDFHGALEPRRDGNGTLRGGAATLAAEIRNARDE